MMDVAEPRRPHVRLTRVGLRDFRNYAALDLRLDGRHVCLYGQNGSGKTNLIEAVSMLSPGRGLRGTEFGDLVRQTPDGLSARGWAISADVRDGDIDRRISLALELDEQGRSKRSARLDGVETPQQELGELMRVIWLKHLAAMARWPSRSSIFATTCSAARFAKATRPWPVTGLMRRSPSPASAPKRLL